MYQELIHYIFEDQGYSTDPADFISEDFIDPNQDLGMWHATTALSSVLQQGLKSRSQVRSSALGGGFDDQDPHLVSVTYDEGHAITIADRLKVAIQAAKGEIGFSEVLDHFESVYSLGEPYSLAKALGAPEEAHDSWEEFDSWVDQSYTDTYEFLQDVDDALSNIFSDAEGYGYRVGFTSEREALQKLESDNVGVVQVEAKIGSSPKHVPSEAELRFRPEDIRVIQ